MLRSVQCVEALTERCESCMFARTFLFGDQQQQKVNRRRTNDQWMWSVVRASSRAVARPEVNRNTTQTERWHKGRAGERRPQLYAETRPLCTARNITGQVNNEGATTVDVCSLF